MKKLFCILMIVSLQSMGQSRVSVGMNLPYLLDNTIDLNLGVEATKRVKIMGSVGGSSKTRNIYARGNNNYVEPYNPSQDYYISINPKSSSGMYGKVSVLFLFNLPEIFAEEKSKDGSNFKFYVGPILGVSSYKQTGTQVKTYNVKYDAAGKPLETLPSETNSVSEKGIASGTGFGLGFSIEAKKEISADLGVDILGFSRDTKFGYGVQTIGLGTYPVVRINYNFGKK